MGSSSFENLIDVSIILAEEFSRGALGVYLSSSCRVDPRVPTFFPRWSPLFWCCLSSSTRVLFFRPSQKFCPLPSCPIGLSAPLQVNLWACGHPPSTMLGVVGLASWAARVLSLGGQGEDCPLAVFELHLPPWEAPPRLLWV